MGRTLTSNELVDSPPVEQSLQSKTEVSRAVCGGILVVGCIEKDKEGKEGHNQQVRCCVVMDKLTLWMGSFFRSDDRGRETNEQLNIDWR